MQPGGAGAKAGAVVDPAAPGADADVDAPEVQPWYRASFDTNARLCRTRTSPLWCAEWLAAMDAAWDRPLDPAAPEWQRQPFERNLVVCDALLPPGWCPEWTAQARRVDAGPAYRRRTRAEIDAVAAQEAERRAADQAWKALVARINGRSVSIKDVVDIDIRVRSGDAEAMELLAWMYLKGVGVAVDYARSYALYARAFLAGRAHTKDNLDKIWPYLKAQEKEALRREFGRATPGG